MKGLELAEGFYEELGRTMVAKSLPNAQARVAAGLVGEGSECFGYDDDLSRDHDWDPGFCLWLAADDYEHFGEELQRAYDALPATYMGYHREAAGPHAGKRTGVFAIPDFYGRFIRYDHVPTTLAEWRTVPETNLATATNGRVFSDPLGEFTSFREGLLAFYPEDVRLKKVAARCAAAGQAGQYNYRRCLLRGEPVAAWSALGLFVEAIGSIVFLLNKRYRPFYKWMHRAMKDLPVLGEECHGLLAALCATEATSPANRSPHTGRQASSSPQTGPDREQLVEEISTLVIGELVRQGLSDSESDFLLDHAHSVQERIENPAYRRLHVMLE